VGAKRARVGNTCDANQTKVQLQ